MADDGRKRGRDRARLAGRVDEEAAQFAKKYGVTVARAKELIGQHGNDINKLQAAAAKLGRT